MSNKKKLQTWIKDFVQVATELSPELRDAVNTSTAELKCPSDIFKTLKERGVFFQGSNDYFFAYQSDLGEVLIKVTAEADPRFWLRLELEKREK